LVDLVRFELTTSSMPWKRAPNCATGPLRVGSFIITQGCGPGNCGGLAALPTMELMLLRPVPAVALSLCLMAVSLTSCLARRRVITRNAGSKSGQATLRVTDRNVLIQEIARHYNAIRDFNATVDMVPALGSAEKSKITEYKDVRAYILLRKPDQIRLIGLYPLVRNKAFDMVSLGDSFKLHIPAQNRFITGSNQITELSKNRIENLRPQHFLEALMVRPVDLSVDKVLFENFTDEENAFYILHLVRENGGGQLYLDRTVWFDRIDLQIARQIVFDEEGNILTDARYSRWKPYDNVAFPEHIEINRPRDEYGVVIDIVKMDINRGVTDDKFVLDQPAGTKLQILGQPAPPARPTAKGSSQ
jgi:outer membrane lipoprotein-sorting protein